MTELTVAGLSMDAVSKSPILVLQTTSGLYLIPIWIGPSEAVSISLALQGLEVPRPLTHDLLLSTIETLNCTLKSVQIVRVDAGIFYAQMELIRGSETHLIDCRPSDAVALAIRAKAPILATQNVIDDAALEYPKEQKDRHFPVSAGDGAIAMIDPEHEFSIITKNENANAPDEIEDLAYMDPESKYKM